MEEVWQEGALWCWQCSVTWPEWWLCKYSFYNGLLCWYGLQTFSAYMLFNGFLNPTYHSTLIILQWECRGSFAGFFGETSNSQMPFWQCFFPSSFIFCPRNDTFLNLFTFKRGFFFFLQKNIVALNRIVMCFQMESKSRGDEALPHKQRDVPGNPSSQCSLFKVWFTDPRGCWGMTDTKNKKH